MNLRRTRRLPSSQKTEIVFAVGDSCGGRHYCCVDCIDPSCDAKCTEAGGRTRCLNNLKSITLALISYAARHNAFPPAYTVDANGNRLHSSRTLILPYLDQHALDELIDLSKPWNDPANAKAFGKELNVFSCWSAKLSGGLTTYLGNAATDEMFTGRSSTTPFRNDILS